MNIYPIDLDLYTTTLTPTAEAFQCRGALSREWCEVATYNDYVNFITSISLCKFILS